MTSGVKKYHAISYGVSTALAPTLRPSVPQIPKPRVLQSFQTHSPIRPFSNPPLTGVELGILTPGAKPQAEESPLASLGGVGGILE